MYKKLARFWVFPQCVCPFFVNGRKTNIININIKQWTFNIQKEVSTLQKKKNIAQLLKYITKTFYNIQQECVEQNCTKKHIHNKI